MYSKYERRTDTRSYDDRRSTTSSPRGPLRSCPSGLVRGPARRLETPRLLRERRRLRLPLLRRTTTRRRRTRRSTTRKRNKFLYFNTSVTYDLLGHHCHTFWIWKTSVTFLTGFSC